MRFAPTEEQALLAKSVADVLKRSCTPDDVRAAWSGEGRSPARYAQLAELGILGIVVPEACGGLGLSALDLAYALEETGRFALPEPIADTAAVVAPMLADAAADGPRDRWLAALIDGSATAAIGLDPGAPIEGAAAADVTIVGHDGALYAVPRGGLVATAEPSVDGARRLATLSGIPSPEWRFADGAEAARLADAARVRGAIATSSVLVGLARAMLELAVDYAKVRQQFGAPIGSFQAVKHHLADALIQLEMARPVVLHAAYGLAHGAPDVALRASHAKAMASDAASFVAKKALQCHGAIGYSYEHALHLWMKRAWALSRAWGDAPLHRARAAEWLLDGTREESQA